jgi:carbamoyl-phosphate synthase large subunit
MEEYNVLILSAGRRVELVQCFQNAARNLDIKSSIVAGDCSSTAPALYFADERVMLPRISEPNYIDAIIEIANQKDIALIVPTIDTDLLLLAENRTKIEKQTDAKVLISDLRVIQICRDKINTQRFMEANGFKIPKMYSKQELDGKLEFPMFIKPVSGSSSVNIFKVNNKKELTTYLDFIDDAIVQDFIEGEEYTVDAFLDFNSQIITVAPRLRIATRAGEILKGKIIKDDLIIEDVKRLLETLKPIGHITVQLMKTEKGIEYIEINPRFGGGAPMSIQSGADSCENIYRLLMGEKLNYNENYRDNMLFLRFDKSISFDEKMEIVK